MSARTVSHDGTWKNVTKDQPCQTCGKSDWCAYLDNGSAWICRRQDGPGAIERVDKSGSPYWLFGTPSPSRSRNLKDAERAETPSASIETRDVAYRALLDGLEFDGKRPFPEAETLGYRRCPDGLAEELRCGLHVYKTLGRPNRLSWLGVPGLRTRKVTPKDGVEQARPWVKSAPGFYLPCTDHLGRISALMIRLDEREGNKYRWFRGDSEGAFSGQVPHVPVKARAVREERGHPLAPPEHVIRITEGIKKADVATLQTPVLTLAYPSATTWKLAWRPLQDITNAAKPADVKQVVRHAPDADARTNPSVCGGVVAAITHCMIMGRTPMLEVWDPKHGKGLDDVLLSGGPEAIRVIEGAEMFETLIDWCQTSGHPPPKELGARAVLYRAQSELGMNPNRVLDPAIAEAIVLLEPYSDMESVLNVFKGIGTQWGRKTKFEGVLREASNALKEEEKSKREEKLKQIALRNSGRADLPTFYRGDHVEISQALRKDLDDGVVHTEGAYWRYHPEKGLWAEVLEEELWGIVESYAGAPCNGKPLRINLGDITGTLKVAERALRDRSFFHRRVAGFAFRNGFVTVDGGKVTLHRHSPENRVRLAYPFAYEPYADCPRFKTFLREILLPNAIYPMSTEQKERLERELEKRTQYLLEYVGLSLVGEAPRLAARALILLGDGANGKSTLTEVLEALFPEGSISGVAPHDWTNDQKVSLLCGKLLNIVGELPSKDMEESQRYKGVITGDQRITAKNVYEKPYEFKSLAGQIFNANVLFSAGDGSHGFARRNAVIPLFRVFLDHEQDKHLKNKLLEEAPGIVRALLHAAQAAVARGSICELPETSVEVLEEWKVRSDPVRVWLKQCHPSWKATECGEYPPRSQLGLLFEDFSAWARNDNRWALSSSTFEERLMSVLRDLARQDLSLIHRHWAVGMGAPLISAFNFKGYKHDDSCDGADGCQCTADALERSTAQSRLTRFLADGEIRQKVGGSSSRRLPLATPAMRRSAELDSQIAEL